LGPTLLLTLNLTVTGRGRHLRTRQAKRSVTVEVVAVMGLMTRSWTVFSSWL